MEFYLSRIYYFYFTCSYIVEPNPTFKGCYVNHCYQNTRFSTSFTLLEKANKSADRKLHSTPLEPQKEGANWISRLPRWNEMASIAARHPSQAYGGINGNPLLLILRWIIGWALRRSEQHRSLHQLAKMAAEGAEPRAEAAPLARALLWKPRRPSRFPFHSPITVGFSLEQIWSVTWQFPRGRLLGFHKQVRKLRTKKNSPLKFCLFQKLALQHDINIVQYRI